MPGTDVTYLASTHRKQNNPNQHETYFIVENFWINLSLPVIAAFCLENCERTCKHYGSDGFYLTNFYSPMFDGLSTFNKVTDIYDLLQKQQK